MTAANAKTVMLEMAWENDELFLDPMCIGTVACNWDRTLWTARLYGRTNIQRSGLDRASAQQALEDAVLGMGVEAFQKRVDTWIQHCFGPEIGADKIERNHRFIEEALELVQAGGCTASEAHQLVDYVYNRPVGELDQEVGGVMSTLAAFCNAHGIDLDAAAERELTRVWGKSEKIRAKQAAKPKHSPLPERVASPDAADALYTSKNLHDAVYGEGPLAAEWSDKPHRVLIEAGKEINRLRGQLPADATRFRWLVDRHGDVWYTDDANADLMELRARIDSDIAREDGDVG